MEWMTMPLKRYAEFSGRSRRKEYWMYVLLMLIAGLLLGVVEGALGLTGMVGPYGPLTILFMLATLVPGIAVSVRRLHDTGRSGWWVLIALVPIIGGLALLVFMVLEGHKGPNEYGPDPKGSDVGAAYAA